jgi:hypothetical protein
MMDAYVRRFRVERVVDGDTLWAQVDVGMRGALGIEFRLARIDCPDLPDRDGRRAATDFTGHWVLDHADHQPAGATDGMRAYPLLAQTARTPRTGKDKVDNWSRWLAEIECPAGHNLVDDLFAAGHGVRYEKR